MDWFYGYFETLGGGSACVAGLDRGLKMQHVEIDRAMITLRFKSNAGPLSEYEYAVRKRLDELAEQIPGGVYTFVRAEKETAARYASITVQFKGRMFALQRLIESIENALLITGGTLAETGWE